MAQIATQQEKKAGYEAILKLYDTAEELIHAVEAQESTHMDKTLELVEPVVVQLEQSAGHLSEAFIIFGETGQKLDAHNQKKAESAIRKLFTALNQFCESAESLLLGVAASSTEAAGNLRGAIVNLQDKVKRKHGERFQRIFQLVLWIGDHLMKMAQQLEKVGLGINLSQAIPGYANPQMAVTEQGRSGSFLQAQEAARAGAPERGWSL